ncbi:MAG: hypothetical protein J7539_10915 [Niabella sp.]|nr:hypothetical protein [Niabella sp.]
MKRSRLAYFFPWVLLLIPLFMWLFWLLTPKKELVIAIIDKTVLNPAGQEHTSLTWILNHYRYTKNAVQSYSVDNDYFGFFPKDSEQFRIKGLERFDEPLLERLSNDADMAYIADEYGIYNNEWYRKSNIAERSGIVYGGLSAQDIEFLSKMKQKRKLIMAEFNTFGSPSASAERYRFEELFSLKWTGWIGRYFDILDTVKNKDIPHWLINGYKAQHNNQWPFKGEGIVFVKEDNTIEILEQGHQLIVPIPEIITERASREKYGLPEKFNYPYWFDIIVADTAMNKVNARFVIHPNAAGRKLLQKNGIPETFPAIQSHQGKDYQFWYFSGDFCDNPITLTSSYFKGIEELKFLFRNRLDKTQRKSFFWTVYQPMVSTILADYYQQYRKVKK